MKYLVLLLTLCASPAVAQCPDPGFDAPRYVTTGPGLIAPQTWDVVAIGGQAAPCDDWIARGVFTDGLTGFLPVAPTAVFDLDGMAPHILMVMAQADCAAVLAVRSGDGQWFFGGTARGREEVTLWGAPNAPLQVWVGTLGGDSCAATVTLETFDR